MKIFYTTMGLIIGKQFMSSGEKEENCCIRNPMKVDILPDKTVVLTPLLRYMQTDSMWFYAKDIVGHTMLPSHDIVALYFQTLRGVDSYSEV